MKLYGSYPSPFTRHCRIAILELQEECDFIETDQAASAIKSPAKRVPFLEDGDLFLSDSSSILKYLREKNGKTFLATLAEFEQFCITNTALDATINLFYLERDNLDLQAYGYTKRQAARIASGLAELNTLELPRQAPYNDAQIRLGCYLAWGLFRQRITLDNYENLQHFLDGLNEYPPFAKTSPPAQ